MGPEWSILPAAVEDMSADTRLTVAKKQKEQYIENLPSWADVKDNLGNLLFQKTYA
jgi:hypothetical protein